MSLSSRIHQELGHWRCERHQGVLHFYVNILFTVVGLVQITIFAAARVSAFPKIDSTELHLFSILHTCLHLPKKAIRLCSIIFDFQECTYCILSLYSVSRIRWEDSGMQGAARK